MTTWERLKSVFPGTVYQWIGPSLLWVLAWCLAAWGTEAQNATKEVMLMVYDVIVGNPAAALLGVALVLSLLLHTMSSRLLATMKPKDFVKYGIKNVVVSGSKAAFVVAFKNNHPLLDVRCVCNRANVFDETGKSTSATLDGESQYSIASGKDEIVKFSADIRDMVGSITIGCDVYLNGDKVEAKEILWWRT